MDEKQAKLAKTTHDALIKALDDREWHYEVDEEALSVNFGISGDDLLMRFKFYIDSDRQLIQITSTLPFQIPEDRIAEAMKACCIATKGLLNGMIAIFPDSGNVVYKLSSSYRESLISPNVFSDFIDYSAWAVDLFNDRFLMLGKGAIDADEIIPELS